MNPYLSGLLSRPDLNAGYSVGQVASAAVAPAQGVMQPMLSGNVSAGVQVGQLSLGLMLAGLTGLFVFYLWTKGIQR